MTSKPLANLSSGTWFNYMLRCSDGSLYSGVTNDVPRRVRRHLNGSGSKYVRSRLPAQLAWAAPVESKGRAFARESEIKKMTKSAKESLASEFNPLFKFWEENNVEWRHVDKFSSKLKRMFEARLEAMNQWSYAVPNESALTELVTSSPIVEIGAGTGYWASLVASMGADVIAYDASPPGVAIANVWHPMSDFVHFPMKVADAKVAESHSDRTLFMCWPPRGNMAFRAASNWHGKRLILVGELNFQSCADDSLYDLLTSQFTLEKIVKVPQWCMIDDVMSVWTRRKAA